MRAVRSTDNGVEVVTVPTPEPTGDQVRVRVTSAGICASDLHLVDFGALPPTLGHEFAGLLDDDTPVAVRPTVACGTCDLCLHGREHLCRTIGERMYGVSLDGGMADEVLVDSSCVVPLPASIDPADASLVEPLAVAMHGVHRVGVQPGQRVLVVGGGPVGLCAVAALGDLGATVELEARRDERLRAGERLGAEPAGEHGDYDIVLDAAGTQSSLDVAVRRLRPGGTIGVLGTWWEPVEVGLALQGREATIVPAFTYGHHHGEHAFDTATAVLATSTDLAAVLITHRFGLDDAREAFATAGDRATGAIKVVLHP